MVHFFPLTCSWLPQKHFVNVLHCSCLCTSIENPLMQKQFRSILTGTRQLRLFSSQRKSFMPHYPVLTACLFLICITFWKNLPFSRDKVTLVCGSDGRAAQMGFLVIIAEGTGVPGTQGALWLVTHHRLVITESWGSSVHVSWGEKGGSYRSVLVKWILPSVSSDSISCQSEDDLTDDPWFINFLVGIWEHSNWFQ